MFFKLEWSVAALLSSITTYDTLYLEKRKSRPSALLLLQSKANIKDQTDVSQRDCVPTVLPYAIAE